MKKRIFRFFSAVLVVVMAFSAFSVCAFAATSSGSLGNNVKWSYDSKTKVITVSGSGDMKNFSGANSGQNFNKIVVGTAQYPNKDATAIVIQEGITNISNNAFRNLTGVKSVTIPNSVLTIGQSAFEGCTSLTTANITSNVAVIGAYAFKNTKFASVDMPYTVKTIGDYAFDKISGLNIKCEYNDAGYNYCVKHKVTYTLRHSIAVTSSLDESAKQVKLSLKIKNAVGLNAANFTITYNDAISPVSPNMLPGDFTEATDIASCAVLNETGKISVAVIASDSVKAAQCEENGDYTVITIAFNVVSQADKASFNVSSDMFMINDIKLSLKSASSEMGLHKYTETVTKTPTCVAAGEKTITCAVCDKVTKEEIAKDPANHTGATEVKNAVAATCTSKGNTGDTVCKDCGVVLTAGTAVEKIPHDYAAVVTDATCTADGFTTYTCTVCGESYTGDKVAATGHDYDVNGVCTRCGDITVVVPSFKEGSNVEVREDGNLVVVKGTVTGAAMKDMLVSSVWELLDKDGNPVADTAAVSTAAYLKHSETDAVFTVIIMGDVNFDGRVTAADARMTLRVSAKLEKFDAVQEAAARVMGNTKISASDARKILRVSAKLDTF